MSDDDEPPWPERPPIASPSTRASESAERARTGRLARYARPGLGVALVVGAAAVWGPHMGIVREARIDRATDSTRASSGAPVSSPPETVTETRDAVAQALVSTASVVPEVTTPPPSVRSPPHARPRRVVAVPRATEVEALFERPTSPPAAPVTSTGSEEPPPESIESVALGALAPPAEHGPLRRGLSRTDVMSAMGRVRSAVSACARGDRGEAMVEITVHGATAVVDAVVHGQFAGTEVGSCIARAVRTGVFPLFTEPTFSFTYPFRL